MSLIITVYVREGMVMAADSRLTLNVQKVVPAGAPAQLLSVTSSDSAKKLFLAPNNIGIATCGPADIGGVPIAGFVDSFISEILKGKNLNVEQSAQELCQYFSKLGVRAGTIFHVAGYAGPDQKLFNVDPTSKTTAQINAANQQGANWAGETDVLQRLLNQVSLIQPGGKPPIVLPTFGIPFEFYTLQDAIDFSFFGIRSTIETLRFQAREKTVGGPVDVLIITPDSSRWISHKQLTIRD